MRILTKLAIAAVVVMLLAASLPAEAACGGNPLIRTRVGPGTAASFVWTGNWAFSYYPGYPAFGSTPPFSPNAKATFWALGTGNPAVGPGDDAGTWTFPTYPWMYYVNSYYGGWYAAEIFAGWGASAGIDGCIQNAGVVTATCTCLLMTDDDGTTGYFALASAQPTAGTWFSDLDQPGTDGGGNFAPIIMQPIPAPTVTWSARKAGSNDLDITVSVPTPAAGIYQSGDACACGPTGFKVMEAVVVRGAAAPSTRDAAAWTAASLVGGAPQGFTAMGGSVTVESLCGATDTDVYISTLLEFDSGFTSPIVSSDATRIECGPNVADPERPRFRPGDVRPGRQPQRRR